MFNLFSNIKTIKLNFLIVFVSRKCSNSKKLPSRNYVTYTKFRARKKKTNWPLVYNLNFGPGHAEASCFNHAKSRWLVQPTKKETWSFCGKRLWGRREWELGAVYIFRVKELEISSKVFEQKLNLIFQLFN